MAKTHKISKTKKTEVDKVAQKITVTETEEHLIVDDTPHVFLNDVLDNDDDEDLMFLGSKKKKSNTYVDDDLVDDDGQPALVIRVDDNGFW